MSFRCTIFVFIIFTCWIQNLVANGSHCRHFDNRSETDLRVYCVDNGDCSKFDCFGSIIYKSNIIEETEYQFCTGVSVYDCNPANFMFYANIPKKNENGEKFLFNSNISRPLNKFRRKLHSSSVSQVYATPYMEVDLRHIKDTEYNVSIKSRVKLTLTLFGLSRELFPSHFDRMVIKNVHIDAKCDGQKSHTMSQYYSNCTKFEMPKLTTVIPDHITKGKRISCKKDIFGCPTGYTCNLKGECQFFGPIVTSGRQQRSGKSSGVNKAVLVGSISATVLAVLVVVVMILLGRTWCRRRQSNVYLSHVPLLTEDPDDDFAFDDSNLII